MSAIALQRYNQQIVQPLVDGQSFISDPDRPVSFKYFLSTLSNCLQGSSWFEAKIILTFVKEIWYSKGGIGTKSYFDPNYNVPPPSLFAIAATAVSSHQCTTESAHLYLQIECSLNEYDRVAGKYQSIDFTRQACEPRYDAFLDLFNKTVRKQPWIQKTFYESVKVALNM